MFRELQDLIKARPLTLTAVALDGDRLRVCVVPQGLDADKELNSKVGHHKDVAKIPESAIKALTTPLCLEGTAEELDAEMPGKLTEFTKAHRELRGGIDTAKEEIAAAVKAIQDREKTKTKEKQPSKAGGNKGGQGETSSTGKDKEPAKEESGSLPLEWCAPPASTSSPAAEQTAGSSAGQQQKEA
jgi:PRTRC genetic system protein E